MLYAAINLINTYETKDSGTKTYCTSDTNVNLLINKLTQHDFIE